MATLQVLPLGLPVIAGLATPVVDVLPDLGDAPADAADAVVNVLCQVPDLGLEIRDLVPGVLEVLLHLLVLVLQPLGLGVVLGDALRGLVERLAEALVVVVYDGELALHLDKDDVLETVGLGLAGREAGSEAFVFGDESLVVLVQDTLALFQSVPLVDADLVVFDFVVWVMVVVIPEVVEMVKVFVMMMTVGARALEGDELLST